MCCPRTRTRRSNDGARAGGRDGNGCAHQDGCGQRGEWCQTGRVRSPGRARAARGVVTGTVRAQKTGAGRAASGARRNGCAHRDGRGAGRRVVPNRNGCAHRDGCGQGGERCRTRTGRPDTRLRDVSERPVRRLWRRLRRWACGRGWLRCPCASGACGRACSWVTPLREGASASGAAIAGHCRIALGSRRNAAAPRRTRLRLRRSAAAPPPKRRRQLANARLRLRQNAQPIFKIWSRNRLGS